MAVVDPHRAAQRAETFVAGPSTGTDARPPTGPLCCLALLLALLAAPAAAQPTPPSELPPPPGDVPTVEATKLVGARVGRRRPLLRLVKLDPGPLDEGAIEDARLRLLATGICETVQVRLDRGSKRGRVIVVFRCDERVTTSLDAFHLGSARSTRFWAGAEISDLDPFGVGVGIGAGVVASGDQLAARISSRLPAPWVDDASLRLTLRYLGGQERFVGPTGQRLDGDDVPSIRTDYRRAGFDSGLLVDLGPFLRLDVGLAGDWVQAEPPAGATQLERDGSERPFEFDLDPDIPVTFTLSSSLTWDNRDDPAFPTRGTRAAVSLRAGQYDGVWGGLAGRIEHYFLLPWNSVLRLDAFVGGLFGPAPFYARYFVGDLHPYIPARAMGLNFAQRRGPLLIDAGDLDVARYESLAGRLGFEYRVPLGAGPHREPYGVEFFIATHLVSLLSPDEPGALDDAPPFDVAVDVGLRFETEIGVMGLSIGNLLLLVEP